ncbi:MAG: His kinase protein [Gammaproteobacteria bacterium]|nr:His kinase protein [Gammaproteobacteria bacterium]
MRSTSFLPDFCGTRIVFVVIILAELLAIILTLAQPADQTGRLFNLAVYSLFIQWVALSCIALLCLCRRWLDRLSDPWLATVSYLITLLVSLIITELAWRLFVDRGIEVEPARNGHGLFLLQCMGISAITWALTLHYFYIHHQWGRRIKSESAARFQALQARIRPHFLFNCMNTIASLTRRQPDLAEEIIEDLSDLFRVTLSEDQRLSTLQDEIDLCRRYLRIEKHRLGDRLEIDWLLQDLPEQARIPALILQPLLENAIYHGIELLPNGGRIRIAGAREGGYIVLSIENPLPTSASGDQPGNRLAQENVSERLTTLYHQPELLQVARADHQYRAVIRIPYPYEDIDS